MCTAHVLHRLSSSGWWRGRSAGLAGHDGGGLGVVFRYPLLLGVAGDDEDQFVLAVVHHGVGALGAT